MKFLKANLRHFEWVVAGVFLLLGALGVARALFTQKVVWVSNGLGWDGVHYDRLLRYFSTNKYAGDPAGFPFCGRIGSAYIISISDGLVGFFEFNLVASILFVFVLTLATYPLWKSSVKSFCAVFGATSFLYFAPVKFLNFYPVYMDPPFMLILAFSVFFLVRENYLFAAIVVLLSIPFREAGFYVLPLIVGFNFFVSKKKISAIISGVTILVLGYLLKRLMLNAAECEPQSQISTAFWWLYGFLSSPERFVKVIAGVSMTLGPIFIMFNNNTYRNIISDDLGRFSVFSLIYLFFLSVVGGSDITRIFYSFVPIFIVIFIRAFGVATLTAFSFGLFGWTLTNQIIAKYEQPVLEWPKNDISGFFSQFPDHAHSVVALTILTVWLLLKLAVRFFEPFEVRLKEEAR